MYQLEAAMKAPHTATVSFFFFLYLLPAGLLCSMASGSRGCGLFAIIHEGTGLGKLSRGV